MSLSHFYVDCNVDDDCIVEGCMPMSAHMDHRLGRGGLRNGEMDGTADSNLVPSYI